MPFIAIDYEIVCNSIANLNNAELYAKYGGNFRLFAYKTGDS